MSTYIFTYIRIYIDIYICIYILIHEMVIRIDERHRHKEVISNTHYLDAIKKQLYGGNTIQYTIYHVCVYASAIVKAFER